MAGYAALPQSDDGNDVKYCNMGSSPAPTSPSESPMNGDFVEGETRGLRSVELNTKAVGLILLVINLLLWIIATIRLEHTARALQDTLEVVDPRTLPRPDPFGGTEKTHMAKMAMDG